MKKLGIIRQTIKNLWSCERGAVAPLVGVCAIMMVGAVAVAIDVGRGQVAQSKLQAALDSAGLAAGAVVSQNITEEELKPEAWKYLLENFNGATVDATITVDDFDLVLSDDDHLVTLEARASLPTTFMRIFGHDIMHVAARTEITREMTGLEVAVVLDVTGSMCDPCSKRDAMKAGATDLVEIMFGDNATVDDLWIGIVPFSQGVNIGTGRTDWLSDWAARSTQDNCIGWNHANWSHSHTAGENPRFCATNNANVSTRTWPLTLVDDWMFSSNAGWYFKSAQLARLCRGSRNRRRGCHRHAAIRRKIPHLLRAGYQLERRQRLAYVVRWLQRQHFRLAFGQQELPSERDHAADQRQADLDRCDRRHRRGGVHPAAARRLMGMAPAVAELAWRVGRRHGHQRAPARLRCAAHSEGRHLHDRRQQRHAR